MTNRTFASIAVTLAMSACGGGEPLRMTSAGSVDMSGARGGAIETRSPPPPAARVEADAEPTMVEVSTPPVDAPADAEVAVTTPVVETAVAEEPPAVEESPASSSDARERRRERRSRRRARR